MADDVVRFAEELVDGVAADVGEDSVGFDNFSLEIGARVDECVLRDDCFDIGDVCLRCHCCPLSISWAEACGTRFCAGRTCRTCSSSWVIGRAGSSMSGRSVGPFADSYDYGRTGPLHRSCGRCRDIGRSRRSIECRGNDCPGRDHACRAGSGAIGDVDVVGFRIHTGEAGIGRNWHLRIGRVADGVPGLA